MDFLLHVIPIYGYNIEMDRSSTINIGFVPMTWAITLGGQHENMQILSL
jgi:hypothetical protein